MRSQLHISALLLIGLTMSVAASSTPPVTVVDDIGVTKVASVTDLIQPTILVSQADLAITPQAYEYVNLEIENPAVIPAFNSVVPDQPVTGNIKYNYSYQRKATKIYLVNRDIRLCSPRAVSTETGSSLNWS